ncbi:DUF5984 family protein [Micromonospora vulcania]|uniref:DUF5984 family protein n=1 Tax=Micromonospora vulcania TaxID=1441873 RepID=A0ABW1H492_9ACTN
MLRIQFELRPLADVSPWGGDQPNLHWFGLTSGWYWIETDRHQMLRYSEQAVRRWDLSRPYPHYYVVRLWEDLLVLRWALAEPVPADIVRFVDGTFPRREFPDDDISADVDAAFDLQGDHHLYLGYLTDPPVINCWRHTDAGRDLVTVSQRIPPTDQHTFAGPEIVEVTLPTAEFFAALHDFDRRLIAAMDERVTELERVGPPTGVELDLGLLRAEHVSRSRWLAERLTIPRRVDWDKVRSGIAEISSWPLVEAGH